MIIIVEGLDCSGKTTVTHCIAEEYNLKPIINQKSIHKYVNFETQPYEWKYLMAGNIGSTLDMFRNFDDFVKDRLHLSDYVYTQYFKREQFYDFKEVEKELISFNKDIRIVLCDVEYDDYVERHKEKKEKYLSYDCFILQRNLFLTACEISKFEKYYINTSISDIHNVAKYFNFRRQSD